MHMQSPESAVSAARRGARLRAARVHEGGKMRPSRPMRTMLACAVAGVPFVLVGAATTTASASPAPITIAYVTDLTGPGGSENSSSPAGFEARLDLQNAEGGVDGHKLVPLVIDDQTNPSEIATAVQDADSKAFGIVSQSPLFFLAAKYPNQAGVPVTGTLRRRSRVGHAAVHEHVRLGRGEREPEVPRQHPDRELPQGARGHGPGLLRVQHLTLLQPGRHRHRRLVRARGRQGRRPRHHGVVRRRRLHRARPSWRSRRASTQWCRPWTPTRTTPWRRPSSKPGSS